LAPRAGPAGNSNPINKLTQLSAAQNAAPFFSRKSAVSATRQRLENRRLAETFELEVGGLRYTATIGRFADGRVAEIFLSNHRVNSAADTNARDSAIVCSIALQFGADLETIRKACAVIPVAEPLARSEPPSILSSVTEITDEPAPERI
jgi:hypothetical protein